MRETCISPEGEICGKPESEECCFAIMLGHWHGCTVNGDSELEGVIGRPQHVPKDMSGAEPYPRQQQSDNVFKCGSARLMIDFYQGASVKVVDAHARTVVHKE